MIGRAVMSYLQKSDKLKLRSEHPNKPRIGEWNENKKQFLINLMEERSKSVGQKRMLADDMLELIQPDLYAM